MFFFKKEKKEKKISSSYITHTCYHEIQPKLVRNKKITDRFNFQVLVFLTYGFIYPVLFSQVASCMLEERKRVVLKYK